MESVPVHFVAMSHPATALCHKKVEWHKTYDQHAKYV